jgi:hypothetical protein
MFPWIGDGRTQSAAVANKNANRGRQNQVLTKGAWPAVPHPLPDLVASTTPWYSAVESSKKGDIRAAGEPNG